MVRPVAAATVFLSAATVLLTAPAPSRAAGETPRGPRIDADAARALAQRIDAALDAAWREQEIEPAPAADDATWLRRLSLDLRGVIPTAGEVAEFLGDASPAKRGALIDRWLLSRDFARHLSYVWADALFSQAPRERQRTEALLRPWLEEQFAAGAPFSAVVEGVVAAEEWVKDPGPSSFVLTYQDSIQGLAGAVARSLLGLQIQCAECHDHPFDAWKQEEFNRFAAFFLDVRADHTAGQGRSTLWRIVDRSNEWDFSERLAKLAQGLRRGAPAMGAMAAMEERAGGGDDLVFEGDLLNGDAGSMAMQRAAEADAQQLAAVDELHRFAQKVRKREDALAPWRSDPESFAGLLARLPPEARDLVQRYDARRQSFSRTGFLDGTPHADEEERTRRQALADWINAPANPWHGRAIANRVVAELLGHGLVEPIDDLSAPAADRIAPALLDELAAAFAVGHDLRLLYGALARTRAYAAGTAANLQGRARESAERWLAAQRVRPFSATQLLFSLMRVASPDGAVRHGEEGAGFQVERKRKARVDSLKSWCSGDLPTGKSNYEPSIPSALYLMNGDFTARAGSLEQDPELAPLFRGGDGVAGALDALFRRTLSRPPTALERERFLAHLGDGEGPRLRPVEDLLWALLNSTEFHTRR